jgi:hypothetical protein
LWNPCIVREAGHAGGEATLQAWPLSSHHGDSGDQDPSFFGCRWGCLAGGREIPMKPHQTEKVHLKASADSTQIQLLVTLGSYSPSWKVSMSRADLVNTSCMTSGQQMPLLQGNRVATAAENSQAFRSLCVRPVQQVHVHRR